MCRYSQLLHDWRDASRETSNMALALGDLQAAFDALSTCEDPSSHGAAFIPSDRATRLSTDCKKVAYAAAWVQKSIDDRMASAQAAVLPWKHAESGWQAGHAAAEERSRLWGAKLHLQRQAQAKREQYHTNAAVRTWPGCACDCVPAGCLRICM